MKTFLTLLAVFVATVSFGQTSQILSDGIDGISRTVRTKSQECVSQDGGEMRISMSCIRVDGREFWSLNVDFVYDAPTSMEKGDLMLIKVANNEIIELAQYSDGIVTSGFDKSAGRKRKNEYIVKANYRLDKNQIYKISQGVKRIRVTKSTGKEDYNYSRDVVARAIVDGYRAISDALMATPDIRVGF